MIVISSSVACVASNILGAPAKKIVNSTDQSLFFENPCTGETCSSNGICSPISLRDKIYKCVCYPGYSGSNYEIGTWLLNFFVAYFLSPIFFAMLLISTIDFMNM